MTAAFDGGIWDAEIVERARRRMIKTGFVAKDFCGSKRELKEILRCHNQVSATPVWFADRQRTGGPQTERDVRCVATDKKTLNGLLKPTLQ